jgi:hypothetical protein
MAIRDFFIERELEAGDANRTFLKAIRRYSQDGVKFYRMEWETFTRGTELRDRIGKTLKMALLFNMYFFPNFFKRNGGDLKSAFKPWECYIQGAGDASTACDTLREFYLRFERWCIDVAETLGDDITKSSMFDLGRLKNLVNFQLNSDNKGRIEESIDLLKDCDKAKEAFISGYGRNDFVKAATKIIGGSKQAQENKPAEFLELMYTQTKLEG